MRNCLIFCFLFILTQPLFAARESYDSVNSDHYDNVKEERNLYLLELRYGVKREKVQKNYSIFYTMSKGTLTEMSGKTTLDLNQNSPGTVGASTYYRYDDRFSFSGSFYLSKLVGTKNDIMGYEDEVTIPLEFGVTGYLNVAIPEYIPFTNIYSGIDYEKFSSFNTDELIDSKPLSVRQHKLVYLTLGVSHNFEIFGRNCSAKAGISRSITSSHLSESASDVSSFTGQKIIGYLNVNLYEDWSFHFLYKKHYLVGTTELTIKRLGTGIGYSF